MLITKKNYTNFIFCQRLLFYNFYFKNKSKPNENEKQIEDLNAISQLIYKHFNAYDAQFSQKNENNLTLLKKFHALANATFTKDNLSCIVDLLKKNDNDCYNIYKIKACNNIKKYMKEIHIDVAFQKYVLTKYGLKIENIFVVYLNPNYIRNGLINFKKLFIFEKIIDNQILEEEINIKKNIIEIQKIINDKTIKPRNNCNPNCDFIEYCHADLPKPNVFDINSIQKKYAHELIKKNIITFEDLKKHKIFFKDQRKQIQIDTYLDKKTFSIQKELLKKFLNKISYPLYYLDFEIMSEAIPPFDGTTTYEQIPFQYSLHIEKTIGDNLIHKKFLGTKINCLKELTTQLIKDIPENSCIISFHSTTEKKIIQKLAKKFPAMSEHLKNIANNIIDLLEPFKKGYYYNNMQGNSNSIKNILPVLCPEMKNAYNKLKIIHDGYQALSMFPKLINMLNNKDINKYKKTRKDMLRYCYLDTLSMNKILKVLYNAAEIFPPSNNKLNNISK